MNTTTSTAGLDINRIERAIAREVVDGLLRFGYTVDVFDGEGYALKRSCDADAIMDALHATDEDYLYAHDGDRLAGWVRLVYGNDGYDVIADYTLSLTMALKGAESLADLIADAAGDPYAEIY